MGALAATSEAPLRVQLLGPVRAWHGDDEIELGSARRRAVFTMLALRANKTVSHAELVDGIWGEQPPAKAISILHTYVYDLRQALDPTRDRRAGTDLLATVESSYSLRLPLEQLDEHRFRQHCEAARRLWAGGDPAAAMRAVDAALGLWRGEALDGLSGPFAERHRARLDELRVAAVEQRAALLLARGDHVAVVTELSELIAAFPFRETACGLLMVALYRGGRRAEALELYRNTERALIGEQGIEPGSALRRVHQLITDERPVSADDLGDGMRVPRSGPLDPLPGNPRPTPPAVLIGRDVEAAALRSLLPDLHAGQGGCVWLEGQPGIGKTALLAAVFAEPSADHRVVWGLPDRLADGAGVLERLCAERPLIVVVDDLHSAEHEDLLAWPRLSRLTQRLPLLLFGVCRTFPRSGELQQSRNAVSAAGGQIMTVGPLPDAEIVRLAEQTLDVTCGPVLADALRAVAGNPLYANEFLAAVGDAEGLPTAASTAELGVEQRAALTKALAELTRHKLAGLTPRTLNLLSWAAVLGPEIDPRDLAAVLHAPVGDLVDAVNEATAAKVLLDSDHGLAFQDDIVRQTLLDQRSPQARATLHRKAAATLAKAGAPVERIAAQLTATPSMDAWAARWLLDNIDVLAARDPATAVDLLEHAVTDRALADDQRDALAVHRVRLAVRLGRHPDAVTRSVLDTTTDAEHAGEIRWLLAQLDSQAGVVGKAVADLRTAEADSSVPAFWRARYRALRAQLERSGLDDLDAAAHTADLALAEASADARAAADALTELWYAQSVRRDHATALSYADKALAVVGTAPELTQQRLTLLDIRAFSLQNLDRLDEASETLATMCEIGAHMQPRAGRPHVMLAMHLYWLGQWDAALAELAQVAEDGPVKQFYDLRDQTPLLQHGVAALIAARRGDTVALWAHLRAAEAYPLISSEDHENSDFLLVARAAEAGSRAGPGAELSAMDPLLDLRYGRMTLRHQWLPRLLRLALDVGDQSRVRTAVRVCETEADRESTPARATTAAAWCRALVARDPDALLTIAGYYGEVGRRVELAAALVDAAVVLAEQGNTTRARRTFRDALPALAEFGATSDIDWSTTRMREFGIEEATSQPERPTPAGWHALSASERRIAELAGAGKSNPEIASVLRLSRRDVQSRLFKIMRKLNMDSRADLVDKLRAASYPEMS